MSFDFLFLFQNPAATTATDAASHEKASGAFSLIHIILEGGPSGIAVVSIMLVLSFVTLYIFTERYLTISKASQIDDNFMSKIRASVQTGNLQAAKALCASTDTPVARMVEKGLSRIGKPLRDVHAAVENVGNLELQKMEKNLSLLASIAGVAPMIGLLGTVIGMIMAFQAMNEATNITPQVLSGGIYHALIATAFGLFVGITAYSGYNYLVAKLSKVIYQMETTTVEFIDLLQEPAN